MHEYYFFKNKKKKKLEQVEMAAISKYPHFPQILFRGNFKLQKKVLSLNLNLIGGGELYVSLAIFLLSLNFLHQTVYKEFGLQANFRRKTKS